MGHGLRLLVTPEYIQKGRENGSGRLPEATEEVMKQRPLLDPSF